MSVGTSFSGFRPAVALLLVSSTTGAAVAQTPRPALPDTAPLPSVSATRPAYLARIGRLENPVLMGNGLYRVLVAAAPTAAELDLQPELGAATQRCASGPLRSAPGVNDSDRLVSRNAPDMIVVVVTPEAVGRTECEEAWNATAAAVWHAAYFANSDRIRPLTPEALALEVDGKPVAPAALVSRPAFEWRADRWERAGAQLRYYYDIRLLGSRPDGSVPMLTLRVWGKGEASPSTFVPSEYSLGRLADEFLVWRFANRESEPGIRVSLLPRHEIDGVLRPALAGAADGRVVQGALDAASYLTVGHGTIYDQAVARALVAEVSYRQGDSAVAFSLVASAQRVLPCLRLPAGASSALMAHAERLTSGRCDPHPLGRVALMGLAVPGGAHYAADAPLMGRLATAAVGSLAVSAVLRERNARASYGRYESATTSLDALAHFQSATRARSNARSMAWSAAIAWIADDVFGVALAHYRNRSIARDRL